MPRHEPAIVLEGIVQIYRVPSGEVHALRGVDAAFEVGQLTAVAGPSGSGKSTLLGILALTERPTAGALRVADTDVIGASARTVRRLRRTSIATVTQRPTHNLIPHLNVREHLTHAAQVRRIRDLDAAQVAASVGLEHRLAQRPRQLSGGEQQRLAVAMAMVGTPPIVLADEPTAELDAESAATVISLLARCAAAGSAVIVNTHDPSVMAAADRVLTLHRGTMHSERVGSDQRTVAMIDGVGRIQLPPAALASFPDGRAEIELIDGAIVLRPPARPT
ncbi:MAG: ATP-binding cassette domain-containing protein [Ilumatobacteraceae bacterium]